MKMDSRIIGTWRIVSVTAEDLETGERREAWGPEPQGYINYAPDGRVMVINVRGDRNRPAGAAPTREEGADLFESMLAYAGTYTVEGDTVTHHIDVSWNETWTGTKQVRIARFEDDRVHLSTLRGADLVTGKRGQRVMIWEKVK
jgi:hypothetical protein